jgi:O-antigen/teichoic acid export membrane protein
MIFIKKYRRKFSEKFGTGSEGAIFRNMAKLVTGDGIARVIGLATTPIITRIYLPEHMGVLSVFTAIIAIIAPLATFRYSTAIPLPKNDGLALNLVTLSFSILLTTTTLTFLVFALFSPQLLSLFSMEQLIPFWYLIPIAFFGTGCYELLSQWTVRKKSFSVLAKTKISQKVVGAFAKILLGLLGLKPLGLLIGQVFTQAGGILSLAKNFQKGFNNSSNQISKKRVLFLSKWYSGFPKYRVPSQFLLTLTGKTPLLFFAWKYNSEVTGQIGLALMMLSLPITLIGASTGKAFYAEIAVIGKKRANEIFLITTRIIKKLSLLSIIPFILIVILGPWLFQNIFGDLWREAGVFARYLSIYLLAQFVYSPISEGIFNVFEKQSLVLAVEISRLTITFIIFLIAHLTNATPNYTLMLYSLGLTLHYSISTIILMNIIKKKS